MTHTTHKTEGTNKTAYPLCWPEGWRRTHGQERRSSKFCKAQAGMSEACQVKLVGVRELRERFGLGPRRARRLICRMRHVADGSEVWTTEGWLAEWLASQALPGSDWPAVDRDREPVDEDVVQRAVELVGVLAERGSVIVKSVNGLKTNNTKGIQ